MADRRTRHPLLLMLLVALVLAACGSSGGPSANAATPAAPDQYKEMPGFEKIDGLGDGAFAYGTGSFDSVILVGDRTVDLGASGFTPDDRARVRQAVLDLATTVLGGI